MSQFLSLLKSLHTNQNLVLITCTIKTKPSTLFLRVAKFCMLTFKIIKLIYK